MFKQRRFKSKHNAAVYHCISRTVNGEKLFDDTAKEMLRKHLHQVADFCGVQIITYAMMTNHFHVLVRVPEQGVVSDKELLRRYKVLYPEPTKWATAQIAVLESTLQENGPEAQKLRDRLLARMGDLSAFMQTFKHRFSIWYNRSHKRFGPLWSERFTSTIIEGNHHFALQMVAAYVDLNPVRAGIVNDPKDYRWCGYGEAEAIGGKMLDGLRQVVSAPENLSDKELLAAYRLGLFGKAAAPKRGDPKSARINPSDFDKVMKADGKLPWETRLSLRRSWFTRGAVIGGQKFVQEHLKEYRANTKRRRHLEPRPFSDKEADAWSKMQTMRRHK
jgi:REP element-mobilizing transposase RayT